MIKNKEQNIKKQKRNENIYILSIETSSSNCSVAISENNVILSEYTIFKPNVHDRLLANLSKQILADLQIPISKLNAVAVSSGPGSFTGLRVGASFSKGFCYDDSIKLIAVPTLSAIALFAKKDYYESLKYDRIIPIVKSHQDLYYYQIFDNTGEKITEIIIDNFSNINKIINKNDLTVASNNFKEKGINIEYLNKLNATFIAKYAYQKYILNKFTDTNSFEPLYVQEFKIRDKKK